MTTTPDATPDAPRDAPPATRRGSGAVRAERSTRLRRPRHGVSPLEATRADLLPAALTGLIVLAITLLPLVSTKRFYFTDDTAGGAYGQWYELGERLRAGEWPMLSLESWMAGNHIAEGQWGLYNPVVWIIGLLATEAPQPWALAAGVKIFFLVLAGVGTFFLTRSYGARRSLAVLAGVAAPLSGWTLYLDATAWVTNLEVWAYFPWTLWAVRRYMHNRRGAAAALVAGLLLVTVGYVQGTVMVVLMFLALAVEAIASRRWPALGRMLLIGVPMGLMAVTVYLPGVLSSSVTVRANTVENTGFMTLTLNGLAVSANPSGRPDLSGWWGRYPNLPYTYIAWFLPLVLLVSARRVRALGPRLLGLAVFGGLVLAMSVGPSQLGPLRFPIRSMPWVALSVIVVAAVLLSRGVDTSRIRARAPWLVLSVAFAGWLSYSAVVTTWRIQIVFAAVCAILLVVYTLLAGSRRRQWRTVAAIGLIAATAGVSALQTRAYQADASAFGKTGFPTELSTYRGAVDHARGELIAVGNPQDLAGRGLWKETLWGSTWYLADVPAANAYSPTGYTRFNDDLCMDPYYGSTCPELATKLFEKDPETGATLADLMSIDTVQLLVGDTTSIEQLDALPVPAGWRVADRDDLSVTWVRTGAIEPVGGPTWATEGMDVTVEHQDANGVRMKVSNVPADGGEIVLSRLDWPGYRVEGAEKAIPTRGYLLTVDVPAGADGNTIDVTFRPPGWKLEMACLVLSLAGGVVLVVSAVLRRRRDRRLSAKPE